MTREEALRRLRGTWSFELAQGKVRIRDEQLIRTIATIREEQEQEQDGTPERGAPWPRERPLAS